MEGTPTPPAYCAVAIPAGLRRQAPARRRRSSVLTAAWSASMISTPSAVAGAWLIPVRMELAMPSAQSRFTATEAGLCLSSGASSPERAPSTTVTEWPASSTARLTAVCISGRPFTRTSCLALPNREEAPAASTTTWMWVESVAESTGGSAAREESDRERGDRADGDDHGGFPGDFREGSARNHLEHDENGEGRQHQDGQRGEHTRDPAGSADFGGLFGLEIHAPDLTRRVAEWPRRVVRNR